ncbi:hypothetical protein B0H19DRAFT_1266691 [Mycena capillaripes]|nr:hypothetical protein B0H19DRAFT_1266691 [Mycena capillaripes]
MPNLTPEQASVHRTGRHRRELFVVSCAVTTPEDARARGVTNLAKVAAATADNDQALTTDKFQAIYASLFKTETITNEAVESETALGEGNGKTKEEDSPPLQQPFPLHVPTSFQQATSHAPGKAEEVDNNPAYQLVFAPGLMAVASAFRNLDPVAVDDQINLNIIAMELYKAFKGGAPPTDLQFVLRFNIANSVTQASIESVYTGNARAAEVAEEDTEWVRWDVNTYRDDVAMLLGTDNGLASTFLLVDYKTTIGGKTVAAVLTRRQAGVWAMATEYS